jgi:hypothetical protein
MPLSPLQTRSITTSRQAQQVVASRAVIDQAKGVLIHRFQVDAEGAFKILRDWAAATNSTVQVVAQTLVHGVCLEDTSRRWDPTVLAHLAAALAESGVEQPRRVPRQRPRWTE